MPDPSIVAVLTGDLVAHVRAGRQKTEAAMQVLAGLSEAIAAWTGQTSTRFTRFRGDGWQIYLAQPRLALRAAVVLQGGLIAQGMKSRIAIGIGAVDSLGTDNLADASGAAFETSGHGLDALADPWRLSIGGAGVIAQDGMIADLIGERMDRWTAAQAEAASMQLAPGLRTLSDIGGVLGISPQAVNDRVRGAGCHALASVLRRWEAAAGDDRWSTG